MSDTVNVVATRDLVSILKTVALDPPAWTRLEPQSVTGDPAPGLEARVHDPLWLLLRQWQFGEFQGEDAGTPLAVHASYESRPISAWQPGDPGAGRRPRALPAGEPLEPAVEREPLPAFGPGLHQRAEAGALLVSALADAGFDARAGLLAACPLPVDEPPPVGVHADAWRVPRALRTMALSSPDGEAAAASLEAAGAGAPPWLAGAGADALNAARGWVAWYRAQVAPEQGAEDASWIPERLEYRFSVRAGIGDSQLVFRAPLHDGAWIDWYTFDHEPGRRIELDDDDPQAPAATTRQVTVLATPLRYAGMPADRLWQFEDGAVNLGQLQVQPHDLARLCFVEFALIYGNDWLVAPVDIETGTFTRLTELAYTTTFGERITVPPADDRGRTGRFRMFEISVAGGDGALPGLFLPPSARGTVEGRALEEVLFLRDETANMGWAVEKMVQGASGDPRNRGDEPRVAPVIEPLEPGSELRYLLATTVPPHWIPLVPIPTTGRGGFVLRKGTMTDSDQSLGELLDPTPLELQEEEIPREGVRVRRVPSLARTADGRTVRWIARRVSVGRGEGWSGLAFDGAVR